MCLHGREFVQEFRADTTQMLKNFDVAVKDRGFVVSHALLLAEGSDQLMHLGQMMAWDHGEQMMFHLVVQSTTEPTDQPSASDIASGGHLQLPEVRALVGLVDRHAVVADAKDHRQKQTATRLRTQKVEDSVEQGHVRHDPQHDGVMNHKSNAFKSGQTHLCAIDGSVFDTVLTSTAPHKDP